MSLYNAWHLLRGIQPVVMVGGPEFACGGLGLRAGVGVFDGLFECGLIFSQCGIDGDAAIGQHAGGLGGTPTAPIPDGPVNEVLLQPAGVAGAGAAPVAVYYGLALVYIRREVPNFSPAPAIRLDCWR